MFAIGELCTGFRPLRGAITGVARISLMGGGDLHLALAPGGDGLTQGLLNGEAHAGDGVAVAAHVDARPHCLTGATGRHDGPAMTGRPFSV